MRLGRKARRPAIRPAQRSGRVRAHLGYLAGLCLLTDEAVRSSDVVVTMGCGDACLIYPGKRYLDWKLDNPAGMKDVDGVRRIRDEIQTLVEGLLHELLPAKA
jgi:hypothetical protein